MAASFIITKNETQPKCLSAVNGVTNGGTTRQLNTTQTISRNELLTHAINSMNLKGIILSERSQSQMATRCMILFI